MMSSCSICLPDNSSSKNWLSKVEELEKNFNSLRSTVTESGITSDCRLLFTALANLSNNIAKQIFESKTNSLKKANPLRNMIVGVVPVARPIDLEDISHATAEHVSWLRRINSFFVNVSPDHKRSYGQYRPNAKIVFFSGFVFSGDESIGWLLVHAFSCQIRECKGVDLMLDNMVRSCVTLGPFLNLKSLTIVGCCIPVKRSSQGCDLIPNLESDVRKLSEVFKNTSTTQLVPMFEILKFGTDFLPLEQICKAADESWNSLEDLTVQECSMLLKLPLSVQSAENIQFNNRRTKLGGINCNGDNENLQDEALAAVAPSCNVESARALAFEEQDILVERIVIVVNSE
nr:disease resistance protein At4g27190-like [Ipomoea batatas]